MLGSGPAGQVAPIDQTAGPLLCPEDFPIPPQPGGAPALQWPRTTTQRVACRPAVFENFRYIAEYAGDDDSAGHVPRFRAEVNGRELEGVDILVSDADEITEPTVLVRPYAAATALRDRMAELPSG